MKRPEKLEIDEMNVRGFCLSLEALIGLLKESQPNAILPLQIQDLRDDARDHPEALYIDWLKKNPKFTMAMATAGRKVLEHRIGSLKSYCEAGMPKGKEPDWTKGD